MKKTLISAILIIGISSVSIAQVRIGPEAGINIGSISRELTGDLSGFSVSNSTRVGLRAGAIADIPLLKNLYLQPGIFYSMRGTVSNLSAFIVSIKQTYSINYLEVPVNIQYKTGSPGQGRLFVGAGPYLGYVIGGYSKTDLDGTTKQLLSSLGTNITELSGNKEKISTGSDSTDEVKPFDIGANINLGYELPIGLIFRAQVGMGFTNTAPLSDVAKQRNWAANITIAYIFGLNRKGKQE